MKRFHPMRNKKNRQRGQMFIEALLIMALTLFVFRALHDYVVNQGWAEDLIRGPFQRLSGVIENGVMGDPNTTRAEHPNHQKRQLSYLGDSGGN